MTELDPKIRKSLTTLQVIANGKTNRNGRLSNERMKTLAREACDEIGLRYDRNTVDSMKVTE
jgi:hypothetical protein